MIIKKFNEDFDNSFFVEEKNLEKAKEIAEKHGVDFYQK